MRRADKEITDREEMEEIIRAALVCRLGMCDGEGVPYVVPVNFGYSPGVLYIHSAAEGRKIDMIGKNPRVCFEVDTDVAISPGVSPCKWSVKYRCVMGNGIASFVTGQSEKRQAMELIFRHYSSQSFEIPEGSLEKLAIIRIDIDSMTGKISGHPR